MQSVSANFTSASGQNSTLHYPAYGVNISFPKTENTSYNFFTIGTSAIGGPDFIPGGGALPSFANQYQYTDYTKYMLSGSVTRSIGQYTYGAFGAQSEVQLDNTSLLFTPNYDPVIGNYIITGRPINLALGFLDNTSLLSETISIFYGNTTAPMNDVGTRQLTLNSFDYFDYLNTFRSQALGPIAAANNGLYINQYANVIIGDLLSEAGLASNQYVAEQSSQGPIGFYSPYNLFIGQIIQALCEAEQAIFFFDENGIAHFWNRQHFYNNSSPVWTFDENSVFELNPEDTPIINDVTIQANPRAVQSNQQVWQQSDSTVIPAPTSTTILTNYVLNSSFEAGSDSVYVSPISISVSDSGSTSETSFVSEGATNATLVYDYTATSETLSVAIDLVHNINVSDSTATSETIEIALGGITGWTTGTGATFIVSNTDFYVGSQCGILSSSGGSTASLQQSFTCTINTAYVAQCHVKGTAGVVVNLDAVENGVTIGTTSVTLDGNWDLLSLPSFTTDGSHTTFTIKIYPTTAQTIKVDAVMVQTALNNSLTYFDGNTTINNSYVYGWTGAANLSTSTATPCGSVTITADFEDTNGALPVASVDLPVYYTTTPATSTYRANTTTDNIGIDAGAYVHIAGTSLINSPSSAAILSGTSYSITFVNTYTQPVYITSLVLWGTPAKLTHQINYEYKNQASITLYGDNPTNNGLPLLIQNDLVQTLSTAQSNATVLVNDYSTAYKRVTADVTPVPQLQIGDVVTVGNNDITDTSYQPFGLLVSLTKQSELYSYAPVGLLLSITQPQVLPVYTDYTVVGISHTFSPDSPMQQVLELEEKVLAHYFTIAQSAIGGPDVLAPG